AEIPCWEGRKESAFLFRCAALGELTQIVITNELDRLPADRLTDCGITQGPQLRFALSRVAGGKLRIAVARVAAQFGKAFRDFGLQHPDQARHADLFQVSLPTPLPVEPGEVADRRVFAQRQPVFMR